VTYNREVAHRIFTIELRESMKFERDPGQDKAPGYLVTPIGRRVNRCLLVGTLTDVDDIGKDTPWWRAQINDPTGHIMVYGGQYSPPGVVDVMSRIEPPCHVLVVGKTNLFNPQEGNPIISLRAETFVPANEETVNRWIGEAAQSILARTSDQRYRDIAVKALESIFRIGPGGQWPDGKNGPV
jgi:RPA family protein